MASVIDIEGVGAAYAERLNEAGIQTVEALLGVGATPKGREQLSGQTGISGALILKWTNHADLFRIYGVAGQYAELLEAAGVDTVPELAQRNPTNLHAHMVEINDQKRLVDRMPAREIVGGWVEQAKTLERVVSY